MPKPEAEPTVEQVRSENAALLDLHINHMLKSGRLSTAELGLIVKRVKDADTGGDDDDMLAQARRAADKAQLRFGANNGAA